MITTECPSSAKTTAAKQPKTPPPITIRSNSVLVLIGCLLVFKLQFELRAFCSQRLKNRLFIVNILIGKTGFVGGYVSKMHVFELEVHKPDVMRILNTNANLLVCAGLPAQKWYANNEPEVDWQNMSSLAQVLATVEAEHAILISTIDVYRNPVGVDESNGISLCDSEPYGVHRAWFEYFFRANFPNSLIVRLPGLFAQDVRKNLIHDLIHGKSDQWENVNPQSKFQFFDVSKTWHLIQIALEKKLQLLNITSEPVTAQQVAELFGVKLTCTKNLVNYDVRSVHAKLLGGNNGYLYSRDNVLSEIAQLRKTSKQ
jgi:hypothetical protein